MRFRRVCRSRRAPAQRELLRGRQPDRHDLPGLGLGLAGHHGRRRRQLGPGESHCRIDVEVIAAALGTYTAGADLFSNRVGVDQGTAQRRARRPSGARDAFERGRAGAQAAVLGRARQRRRRRGRHGRTRVFLGRGQQRGRRVDRRPVFWARQDPARTGDAQARAYAQRGGVPVARRQERHADLTVRRRATGWRPSTRKRTAPSRPACPTPAAELADQDPLPAAVAARTRSRSGSPRHSPRARSVAPAVRSWSPEGPA